MVSVQIIFPMLFGIGVILIYLYGYRLWDERRKRRWVYRVKRVRKESAEVSYIDLLLLRRVDKPRNEVLRKRLRQAGYPRGESYLLFKKVEWGWVLLAVASFFLWQMAGAMGQRLSVNEIPWIRFIVGVAGGWGLLHGWLHWKARDRSIRVGMEIVRLSDRLLMGLTAKTPLYYGIKRAGRTTKLLKPSIDTMLIEWAQKNPKTAIRQWREWVATDEMIPLTNAMMVIVDEPAKAQQLMEQQMKNIETIRDYAVKQRIRSKPLWLVFLVTIPFTAALVALLAPWYSETMRQLNNLF